MINEAMMSPAPSAPSRPFLGAPVSDPRGNELALLQVLTEKWWIYDLNGIKSWDFMVVEW